MDDPFTTHWFSGLDRALGELNGPALDTLMACSAQACSESFSFGVYREQYRASDSLDAFVENLSRAFADMRARLLDADTVEINYTFCTCDLARRWQVKKPKLCLCSLRSLQYNWEAVLGAGSVACRMEQSILRGDTGCRFLVKLLREPVFKEENK